MHYNTATSFIAVKFLKNKKFSIIVLLLLSIIFTLSIHYTQFIAIHHTKSSFLYTHTTSRIHEKPLQHQSERYLAYLPHSGLSNQRIELANALLMASMLNRTLVIPPAFLGQVFGWMPREHLLSRIEWLTTPKNFNKLCERPSSRKIASYVQRSQCEEYRHFAQIHWAILHDFQPLLDAGVRVKFAHIFSMAQIQSDLNVTQDDMYLHNDTQLYDWRLFENKTEAQALIDSKMNYFDSFGGRRYYKVLLPSHFEKRQEKLLFLGGIFGSTRLTLTDPKHTIMKDFINQVLHYRLDTPLGHTVKSIVDHLGGKGSFMSVHFRTGDKPFKKNIATNLETFVQNMTAIVGHEERTDACLNVRETIPQEEPLDYLGNRVKVYIATDHHNPKGERSELLPWFEKFPCTTTLSDLPSHLLDPLDTLLDAASSKSLKKYLIPLVDAMVAAHAKIILTTPRSTFSRYIKDLHHAWTNS